MCFFFFFFFFFIPWTTCGLIIYRINIASTATKFFFCCCWTTSGLISKIYNKDCQHSCCNYSVWYWTTSAFIIASKAAMGLWSVVVNTTVSYTPCIHNLCSRAYGTVGDISSRWSPHPTWFSAHHIRASRWKLIRGGHLPHGFVCSQQLYMLL